LFFALPPGMEVRNSAGAIAPNIDVRGEGGFVVLPPSSHPSGNRYAWSVRTLLSSKRPPATPGWLLSMASASRGNRPARSADEWSSVIEAGVAEGARNDRIAQITGFLLRKEVDLRVTYSLVRAWNDARCRPPLAANEVERTVESIAKREYARRGMAL